jgi:uncharacterized protein (UPF0303 family)
MDESTLADATKAAEHELLLEFPRFNEATAWELGTRLREAADASGAAVYLDIWIGEHCVFRTAMPGTSPANADWARRKRNLVNLLHMSSYRIQLDVESGRDYPKIMALEPRDYVAAGGCFPIRIVGSGVIGVITASGLPSRDDHKLIVNAVAEFLDVDLGDSEF